MHISLFVPQVFRIGDDEKELAHVHISFLLSSTAAPVDFTFEKSENSG